MNNVLSLAYFAGGSKFTLEPFIALVKSKHKFKTVFTKSPKRAGRGNIKDHNFLFKKAIESGVPVKTIDDFTYKNLKFLQTLKLDFIIVFSFGFILPKEVLEIPKYGCINIHASLLPRWRGASPVQHALLHNEKETGYTFIVMNESLDAGDIIYKEKININISDNYESLLKKIIHQASQTLVKKIEALANNKIKPEAQNNNDANYCYRIKKEDTYLKFDTFSKEVFGTIRALSPAPGAKCYLKGELIKVLEAKVEGVDQPNKKFGCVVDESLLISCKYGFIRLIKIQRAGRKVMYAKELLNGWKVEAGTVINEKK